MLRANSLLSLATSMVTITIFIRIIKIKHAQNRSAVLSRLRVSMSMFFRISAKSCLPNLPIV